MATHRPKQASLLGTVRLRLTASLSGAHPAPPRPRLPALYPFSTPISALIFGEPGVANGKAVIELRKDLRLPAALSAVQIAHEQASAEF
ncbi:hypothetical protein QQY66_03480 [Streptomyces sp. DG2A-72]|uniref:hypothetical protein n=1 Tax=Streptomyces sp. DG2A-72 TaxID=3051386 RepID=UPI00265C5CF9|nr:hypothetical protein [Streptomyces sp. DG2A-72]MDO0930783.1 hypothetical protein [Streptomyces sp. DG2A-72]